MPMVTPSQLAMAHAEEQIALLAEVGITFDTEQRERVARCAFAVAFERGYSYGVRAGIEHAESLQRQAAARARD